MKTKPKTNLNLAITVIGGLALSKFIADITEQVVILYNDYMYGEVMAAARAAERLSSLVNGYLVVYCALLILIIISICSTCDLKLKKGGY